MARVVGHNEVVAKEQLAGRPDWLPIATASVVGAWRINWCDSGQKMPALDLN